MDKRIEDFYVGDRVIHPKHGAGTIIDIKHETIAGISDLYYVISIKAGSALLPKARARKLGLRKQTDVDLDFDAVRAILKKRPKGAPKHSPAALRELREKVFQSSTLELATTVHKLRQTTPGSQLHDLLKLGVQLLVNLVASSQCCTLEEAFAMLNEGLEEPFSHNLLERAPVAAHEAVPAHPLYVTVEQTRHQPTLGPSLMEERMAGASRSTLPPTVRTEQTETRPGAPTVLRVLSGPTRALEPTAKQRKQKSRRANPKRAERVPSLVAKPEVVVQKAPAMLKGFADLDVVLDEVFADIKKTEGAPPPHNSGADQVCEPKPAVDHRTVATEPLGQAEESLLQPDLPYEDLVTERDHLERTVGDLIARLLATEAAGRAAQLERQASANEVTSLQFARDNALSANGILTAQYAELSEKHARLLRVAKRWQAGNEALTAEKLALEEALRAAAKDSGDERTARQEAESSYASLKAETEARVHALEAEVAALQTCKRKPRTLYRQPLGGWEAPKTRKKK